jgi:hypothetical protein
MVNALQPLRNKENILKTTDPLAKKPVLKPALQVLEGIVPSVLKAPSAAPLASVDRPAPAAPLALVDRPAPEGLVKNEVVLVDLEHGDDRDAIVLVDHQPDPSAAFAGPAIGCAPVLAAPASALSGIPVSTPGAATLGEVSDFDKRDIIHQDVSIHGMEYFFRKEIKKTKVDAVPLKKAPESIKKHLESPEFSDCEKKLTLVGSVPSHPHLREFVFPTRFGIMLLCSHYYVKYGIEIFYVESEKALKEAIKGPLTNPSKAWGVIVTNPGAAHVTGILCYKKDSSSPTHVLELDSIEDPNTTAQSVVNEIAQNVYDQLLSAHKEEFEVYQEMRRTETVKKAMCAFRVKGARQLDPIGCRTDALCLLKDGIRFFNTQNIDNMAEFLKATQPYQDHPWSFYLPSFLAKTIQKKEVLTTSEGCDTIFSKTSRTLCEFRNRYLLTNTSREDTFEVSISFPGGREEIKKMTNTSTTAQNSYLNYKGKRNLEKMKAIIEGLHIKNPEIRRRYRNLEAFLPGEKIFNEKEVE